MRRRLSKSWPALAHWFGVMPWDVDRLTPDELMAFCEAVPKSEPPTPGGAGRRYGPRR